MNGDETKDCFTRRHALIAGMTVAAGAAVLGLDSVAVAKAPKKPRFRTKGFKRARFEQHIGAPVKLRPAGAPAVRGRLVAVEDLAGASAAHLAGSQNAYLLRFRVAASLQAPQGTVGIRNKRFGVVRLFVTPSTRTARYQDYVAIVNRVVG